MKKILLISITILSFLNISLATTIQGTLKKIDNNIVGVYLKVLGGSINQNSPNMVITVSIPSGGGAPPVLTFSSPIPNVSIAPEAVDITNVPGRWVYAFGITGGTSSTVNWAQNSENLALSVTFPAGANTFAKVAQLNDYSGLGGGFSGNELFDIGFQGSFYVDYNVMFYGAPGSFFNGGPSGNSFSNAPAPLPVTLVSFKADKFQDRSSHLVWSTASESNSSHFIVQSSTDKKSWTNLGSVKAAGESQLIENYEYFDYNVYNGRDSRLTVYYRLQMVDLDGQVKTSPVEAVVFGNGIAPGREFVVYPNPASDGVQVEWDANRIDQPTSLEFFDLSGKLIYSQKVEENTDQEYIDFGKTNIQPGLYLLRILNGQEPLDFKQIMVGQR